MQMRNQLISFGERDLRLCVNERRCCARAKASGDVVGVTRWRDKRESALVDEMDPETGAGQVPRPATRTLRKKDGENSADKTSPSGIPSSATFTKFPKSTKAASAEVKAKQSVDKNAKSKPAVRNARRSKNAMQFDIVFAEESASSASKAQRASGANAAKTRSLDDLENELGKDVFTACKSAKRSGVLNLKKMKLSQLSSSKLEVVCEERGLSVE